MNDKKMLAEFKKNLESKRAELLDLQANYIIKEAENILVKERFAECYDRVLEMRPYYAARECTCGSSKNSISIGDRILTYPDDWLMSEEDHEEFLAFVLKEFIREGLTDNEGRYTEETDTENQLTIIKDEILQVAVDLLPDGFLNKNVIVDAIHCKGRNWFNTRNAIFDLTMRLK